jgi:hypothetical protein
MVNNVEQAREYTKANIRSLETGENSCPIGGGSVDKSYISEQKRLVADVPEKMSLGKKIAYGLGYCAAIAAGTAIIYGMSVLAEPANKRYSAASNANIESTVSGGLESSVDSD